MKKLKAHIWIIFKSLLFSLVLPMQQITAFSDDNDNEVRMLLKSICTFLWLCDFLEKCHWFLVLYLLKCG